MSPVRNSTAAFIMIGAFAMLVAGVHSAQAAAALVSKDESKCAATLGKGGEKVNKTVLKETAKCREADISGKTPGACPTVKNTIKIDKAKAKLAASTAKKCKSVCALSQDIECISDAACPPLDNAFEKCSAGAKARNFDLRAIGFPGPFCDAALGGVPIDVASQIGECTANLTEPTSNQLIDVIYGSLSNASGISKAAQGCLKTISKDVQKIVSTTYKGIVKCRKSILDGKVLGDPGTCTSDDVKLAAKIAKAEAKLGSDMTAKCTDAAVLELDLCGNGVGGTVDIASANSCLLAAAREITDSSVTPGARVFAGRSLIEASYPPKRGVCGDGVINQLPNPFALLGEECDGASDAACPGACLPPGDLYECTCPDVLRMRFMAEGLTADLDNGWTGTSHNSGVTDKAGYIMTVSNCDCSLMDGFACDIAGGATSIDPICDTIGPQLPTCSWDPSSSTSCDTHGNNNGASADSDCFICDSFNLDAGSFCSDESQCQAQCYPAAGGAPTGLCARQSDCSGSDICRGQCDRTQTCLIIPNGHPLPISSGGTAVCILNQFRFSVFGTQNIITGEHESFVQQFSKVHLGVTNTVPCPMCGGFCDGGGPLDGDMCTGSCSTAATRCRFDVDCPGGETCTTSSIDCPSGFCNLSLVCAGGPPNAAGPNVGLPCRVGALTDLFGTTSSDCPPKAGQNISGDGLEINFLPSTSELVVLPPTVACDAPGFELYDCECPSDGGRKTQPNLCAGSCDAIGANFGEGCANGGGFINGGLTTCAAGANGGRACDEDSDCPGSTCSANPFECSGDPAFANLPCSVDADCGLGTCVDACPGGRCVPLCLPGLGGDTEEGFCSSGPSFNHCDGATDTFRVCSAEGAAAGCSRFCQIDVETLCNSDAECTTPGDSCLPGAVCATSCSGDGVPTGGSGTPCSPDSACPSGEICCGACKSAQLCEAGIDGKLGNIDDFPGAGTCIADLRNCFVQPITVEGGDTINGKGDPNRTRTVTNFCIGATSNPAINSTAGLGGPGRLRQNGNNVTNGFTSLP